MLRKTLVLKKIFLQSTCIVTLYMYMHKKVVLGYIYLIAKLLYMLALCTCVVVVDVVVDGVVIGFEDNTVVDTVFYRECIEGYVK